jgi:3'(2'), 5'-bisphosphate nucleotidase
MPDYRELVKLAVDAAVEGGMKIMEVYNSAKIDVMIKKDFSPLTQADLRSNQVIRDQLFKTKLPVLSEEDRNITYEMRKDWDIFWLVDPLDGTREFIERKGEFTVNIALIEKNIPAFGVIYAPFHRNLYFSVPGEGSYKISEVGYDSVRSKTLNYLIKNASPLPLSVKRDRFTVIGSRSHMSIKTKIYLKKLKRQYRDLKIIQIGSSLKFCLIAEGEIDLYPRFSPSMEWDIAAGHAIIEGAGFKICEIKSKNPLIYNKKDLRNPPFMAGSSIDLFF